jgi:hypothetical protein
VVALVNGAAGLAILVRTPLLGAAFSLPDGRLGFTVLAGVWASSMLVPRGRELRG